MDETTGILKVFESVGSPVAIAYICYLMVREITGAIHRKRKGPLSAVDLKVNGNMAELLAKMVSLLRKLERQHDTVSIEHKETKDCILKLEEKLDGQTRQLLNKHDKHIQMRNDQRVESAKMLAVMEQVADNTRR